jgi:hypothetical protein
MGDADECDDTSREVPCINSDGCCDYGDWCVNGALTRQWRDTVRAGYRQTNAMRSARRKATLRTRALSHQMTDRCVDCRVS